MTTSPVQAVVAEMRAIAPQCEPDWDGQLRDWADRLASAQSAAPGVAGDDLRLLRLLLARIQLDAHPAQGDLDDACCRAEPALARAIAALGTVQRG